MLLSWNEIRHRAVQFAQNWSTAEREIAEKQTFWNDFFKVFGLRRRTVASFEEPVKNIRGHYGFIDLFWRGTLLVEHKSLGEDLGEAGSQAFEYIQDLVSEGREEQVPRFVIVSDFAHMALHDLEPKDGLRTIKFALADFPKHVREFAFLGGEKPLRLDPEDPANERAYKIMSDLHDILAQGGFSGHKLKRFLVRILFCLFSDDTGIFEPCAFLNFIERHTRVDGSDLGAQLAHLFDVLNTSEDDRQTTLDEDLAAFPFVNGELFEESLGFADFNSDMRKALLECCQFQWARISPAVFGSLFQGVMDSGERRQSGGHYTSERNILKVVRSLFLDELRSEMDAAKADRSSRRRARLEKFHQKLRSLRFFDPACGCGNFLVITYRELRRLELEVLCELHGRKQEQQRVLNIRELCSVDVDQFYGIEISEWPVRIAEVALWLMDHQMNVEVADAFGQNFRRLPLRSTPHITQGNALRLDWKQILLPTQCSYLLGNPPFVGKQFATEEQKSDMRVVCDNVKGSGVLDYVTGWYFKAAEYIRGTRIAVGFVSTNSITQGEQVGILWDMLFKHYRVKIHFGHRPFKWDSEARGKAHVHVVIIGFANFGRSNKRIYDYEGDDETATVTVAQNISPYLIEGNDSVVLSRSQPICEVPEIVFGNMPNDGGHLLLTDEERKELLQKEPNAKKYIRLFLGSQEFINGETRWCLWLKDASPAELRAMPEVMKRVKDVSNYRRGSPRPATRKLAQTPTLFGEIRQPNSDYLLIPSVSSENRKYIPIGFMPKTVIGSNLVLLVPGATLFHFGILTSAMHMAWVGQVCGRLESRYRYSNRLVYNNYPWPTNATPKQRAAVEAAAKCVLDVRKKLLVDSNLADLYDPLAMPPALLRAHANLDRVVDKCYRSAKFRSDRERVEFLFVLYDKLLEPLIPQVKRRRRLK